MTVHRELINSLPDLLRDLRQARFEASVDQYLAASDLLGHFRNEQKVVTQAALCAALAGIFSSSPQQQEAFPELFNRWYERALPQLAGESPTPTPEPVPSWQDKLRDALLRYWPVLSTLLLAGVLIAIFWQDPPDVDPPIDTGPNTGVDTEQHSTELDINPDILPPRPVQQHVTAPPAYRPWWVRGAILLWLLPVSAWLSWLLWLLVQRRLVARRRKNDDLLDYDLAKLNLSPASVRLFTSRGLDPFWRRLREYRRSTSKRLNVDTTVKELIRNGGYFEPYYRDRATAPAYLALIDSLHQEDHTAGLASHFVRKLQREHIQVADLIYRIDPRYTRLRQSSGFTHTPRQLQNLYTDHDLLLLGDGLALFDQQRETPVRWIDNFEHYENKWLLSPRPLWPWQHAYRKLQALRFSLAPLTTPGLTQHGSQQQPADDAFPQDSPFDLPAPRMLDFNPLSWMEERRPDAKVRSELITELRDYLGREGYLLLCATAAYPELRWALTQALDAQLGLDDGQREWRLRKLARLPWHRRGRIPNTIRHILLRSLAKADIQRITKAFDALQDADLDKPMQVPVAIQKAPSVVDKDTATQSAEPGNVLGDPVFASVIRGRKPRLLEVQLLASALTQPIRQDWRSLLWPLLVGVLVLPVSLWLNTLLWTGKLQPDSRQDAVEAMLADNATVEVIIEYRPELIVHQRSLGRALANHGFKFAESAALQVDPKTAQQGSDESVNNSLRHNIPDQLQQNLLRAVTYQLYGVAPEVVQDTSLATNSAVISLQAIPTIFQDPFSSDSDQTSADLLLPQMVNIPGGCFQMGSPESEPEKRSDEQQHEVCVEAFQMGQYEVTFAEYDVFAEATGREKPADEGWGRDRQPVVNVSWEDATAYAAWLSDRTGQNYRLPTEAEWEYAARAGRETAYWWGPDIGQGNANCGGCGSQWDFNQTAPVGSFKPNAFDLYDTAGNVYEWTCSIYDENYEGGEQACAAVDQEGGRVLRGGSWGGNPQWLRSADRSNYGWPANRHGSVGFRLARAIP